MSSSNKVILAYVTETTQGTTPASALKNIPFVSADMNTPITTTESAQISATRATLDIVQTQGTVASSMNYEGQYNTYAAFEESALGGTFSAGQVLTATDISFSSVDNSINSAATAFTTTVIKAGSVIKVAGSPLNSGLHLVVSATTGKVILSSASTITTEATGASITVTSKDLRDGSTIKSLTLEEYFSDLTTTYQNQKGVVVDTMSLDAKVGSIVTGTFAMKALTGTTAAATVGTGANVSQDSNEVWSPIGSFGTIYENGAALSGVCVSGITLSTSNSYRENHCLGSLFTNATHLGSFKCNGKISLYFNSVALLTKFKNATTTSLRFGFTDTSAHSTVFYMPNVKYKTGTIGNVAKDGDIMLDLDYEALYDSTLGFALQISSLA